MATESNINSYYEEIVASMAERALENCEEWEGEQDESEPIWQAIDDGLMYYCDQGYVLAMAICRGYASWYKDISWDEITEMLYNDVVEEMEWQKKQKAEA